MIIIYRIKMKYLQVDIDNFKNKLLNKIFDVYVHKQQKYYIDVENKIILDKDKNIVGIINNAQIIFFEEDDNNLSLLLGKMNISFENTQFINK